MRDALNVLMSSANQNWETPRPLFNRLAQRIPFTIDVAASKANALCRVYYTEADDALRPTCRWRTRQGRGLWWCNPPYGRIVERWVPKAVQQRDRGNYGVMLLPHRSDTKWYHSILYVPGISIEILPGRLMFTIDGKPMLDKKGHPTSATFPSILVFFGPNLRLPALALP